jgi:hypothetical protein
VVEAEAAKQLCPRPLVVVEELLKPLRSYQVALAEGAAWTARPSAAAAAAAAHFSVNLLRRQPYRVKSQLNMPACRQWELKFSARSRNLRKHFSEIAGFR